MVNESDPSAATRLRRLIDGFQVSDALVAVARLDVASCLRQGARTADALADELGVDADALYRVLRALASVGVFTEGADRSFALNDLAALLVADAARSLRGWAIQTGRPYYREAWANLEASVRTGENSFKLLHGGASVWQWRADQAEESAVFDAAMTSLSSARVADVVAGYEWGQFQSVADVGGGRGMMLAGD